MKYNVGTVDRMYRMAIGVGVVVIGIIFGTWWGAFGLILVATALIGWCPLYRVVNFSTANKLKRTRPGGAT